MRWRDFDELPHLSDDFFNSPRRVHFIGIGGIGMSALAFLLAARGHAVSGSDANDSALLDKLRAAGVSIVLGHQGKNIERDGRPVDAIIFGSAITPENPERAAARAAHVPQFHRAQLLAHFVNRAKVSIAVSGTHGKSTTSAMIAHILDRAGKNPTALLGAEYPPFGSNVRLGDEDLVVVEADESDGSFTLCKPTIAVVTNIEAEHLENYGDSEDELWRAFEMFIGHSAKAVLNADDTSMYQRLAPYTDEVLPYGATITMSGVDTTELEVGAPGRHNWSNALGALTAAQAVGVDPATAAQALPDFHGVARRFQFIGETGGVRVYDDYAHHPTEVQSTLEAARDFLQCPLVVIFQPHRYSRTAQMGREFGPSFAAADRVIITQLYSAFEEVIPGVSGRIVYDAVREQFPDKSVDYVETLDEARARAVELATPGAAILTMGAGDIGKQPGRLLEDLKKTQAA